MTKTKPKAKGWKLLAAGVVGGVAFLLTRPAAAKKPVAKPAAPQTIVSGTIRTSTAGAVTVTEQNFYTGASYQKTWTAKEWAERTAALNAGDPYMDDSWKRQSSMTDADWAQYERRETLVSA